MDWFGGGHFIFGKIANVMHATQDICGVKQSKTELHPVTLDIFGETKFDR